MERRMKRVLKPLSFSCVSSLLSNICLYISIMIKRDVEEGEQYLLCKENQYFLVSVDCSQTSNELPKHD